MSDDFKIIKGEMNCSAISKTRLFKKDKHPGSHLKFVLIQKKAKDQFGRTCFMVKEDVTQEERAKGIEGGFIGNAYLVQPKTAKPPPPPAKVLKPGELPY